MTFNEAVFKFGASFRNPTLFKNLDILIVQDFAPREELMRIKEEKLRNLLDYFRIHSSFYSKLIPEKYSSPFVVLSELPLMDKKILTQNIESINTYKLHQKLLEVETSGTSGVTFKFKKNIGWDTMARASWMRGYSWYDVNPWDKNGYFWGYNIDGKARLKTEVLDLLQNRFRLFSYDEDAVRKFLSKLKQASFLHGYSSMIYEVARIGKELGFSPADFPNLKMIKGTSEKIFEAYQKPVLEVFGKKIISEYGSAETGIMAFECPQGNMHINEENVIIEEEDGAAIVTNLNAFSLPIIRYRLNDAIIIDNEFECSCGRKSGVVLEVLGRVGKMIRGFSKSYPSLTLYYVFKNLSLNHGIDLQYQGVQKELGKLNLKIANPITIETKVLIEEELRKYFAKDLIVRIKDNAQIHDKQSKLTDFKTFLNV